MMYDLYLFFRRFRFTFSFPTSVFSFALWSGSITTLLSHSVSRLQIVLCLLFFLVLGDVVITLSLLKVFTGLKLSSESFSSPLIIWHLVDRALKNKDRLNVFAFGVKGKKSRSITLNVIGRSKNLLQGYA